jgi:hypothetical protein
MAAKTLYKIFTRLFLLVSGIFFCIYISSCGKATNASPAGLNIQYQIFNFSPDMGPINLFINFQQVNALGDPFVFEVNHGYFYIPSNVVPFQFRTAYVADTTIFQTTNTLTSGAKYTIYITGAQTDHSLTQIFTVDTAVSPAIGYGLLRFVDASPTGTGGLDVTANGTPAFSKVPYKTVSTWLPLPIGNYDLKINATGNTAILNEQPSITIQDGRAYTLYAYGYTSRVDSAAFNAAVTTNK